MFPRCARVLVAALVITMVGAIGSGAALAAPRGEGTMLVRQSDDCSGTGNDSSVSLPFSLLFTGFAPDTTGTVTAFTQPGGDEVGSGTVMVDSNGEACVRVTGEVPTGQYKIVYDFGSGTGKQKVIRITDAEPEPTELAVVLAARVAVGVADHAVRDAHCSDRDAHHPNRDADYPGRDAHHAERFPDFGHVEPVHRGRAPEVQAAAEGAGCFRTREPSPDRRSRRRRTHRDGEGGVCCSGSGCSSRAPRQGAEGTAASPTVPGLIVAGRSDAADYTLKRNSTTSPSCIT